MRWHTAIGKYEVSSTGSVRNRRSGRVLKQFADPKGYTRVTLSHRGTAVKYLVHRLVLTAFVRTPLPGEQANHLNGNPSDNRLGNLSWCTGRENVQHALRVLGRRNKGEDAPSARLTNKQALLVRKLAKNGWTRKRLSIKFSVGKSTINSVISRRTFKEI